MPNQLDDFAGSSFLGARVVRVSASIEWGSSSSSATIDLVEDDREGDVFTKPDPGTPAIFSLGSFSFGGIVQRWLESHGFNGNPIYSVTLVDPREILAGAQIITSNYSGDTLGLPNLVNAFGYYPFGVARTNDIGMPWENIRPVLNEFVFQYMGYSYTLDLTEIPIAPSFYRIEGTPVVSVIDALEQVCEDSGYDMFVVLQPGNVIKVKTVSRQSESPSAINNILTFVNQQEGKIPEYSFGRELNNDTNTSVFLFGHPVHALYQSENIEPFWGFDVNGNPILSRYGFKADIRHLFIPELGGEYEVNVDEIAVALGGSQEVWEYWLELNRRNILVALGIVPYINPKKQGGNFLINLDKNKAKRGSDLKTGVSAESEAKIKRLFEYLQNVGQEYYGLQFAVKIPAANRYYDSNTGQMVYSLEPVDSAWKESDVFGQGPIGLPEAYEETFQNEDQKFRAFVKFVVGNNQFYDFSRVNVQDIVYNELPQVDIFGNQQGTIKEAYVGCTVSKEIYVLNNFNQYFTTDVNSIIQDFQGVLSQFANSRAFDQEDYFVLIKLDAPVFVRTQTIQTFRDRSKDIFVKSTLRQKNDFIQSYLNNVPGATLADAEAAVAGSLVGPEQLQELLDNSNSTQTVPFLSPLLPVMPALVAVPLQNNQQYYGPWALNSRKIGRAYAFQDTSISPWNYGSSSNMNIAALDTIYRLANGQQIVETGKVSLAGIPIRGLGDTLVGGQPIVTQISIDYGVDGVTTTYQMQTFTMKFGDFGKQRLRGLAKMGRFTRKLNRYIGSIAQALSDPRTTTGIGPGATIGGATSWANTVNYVNGYMRNATNLPDMAAATMLAGRAGSNIVSTSSAQNFICHTNTGISGQFEKTAGSDTSSVFRAISTNPQDQYFPHMGKVLTYGVYVSGVLDPAKTPSGVLSGEYEGEIGIIHPPLRPSWIDLNPYQSGNDMQILSGPGYEMSENYDPNYARPIALRGPLVVAGWGYDTAGNPVPNAGSGYPEFPSKNFAAGYLTEVDKWKVGPVDLRWDDDRAVWTAANTVLAVVVAHNGSGGQEDNRFIGGRPKYTCRTSPVYINDDGQILYNPDIPLFTWSSGAVDFEVMNIRENANDIHTLASGSPVLLYSYGKHKFMNEHVRTMIRSSDYQFF